MTYTEDQLLPLSGVQHVLFCERQCALIHVERLWVENRYTAEGRVMHERAHAADGRSRSGVRTEYGVALRSLALGLTGQADVVEFHRQPGSDRWRPFPVEYKRGKAKKENWDRVQLCAQALCLEEMLDIPVPAGALFYGKTRRREDVLFDADLRRATRDAARRFHDLAASKHTPGPVYAARCRSCSFVETCLPKTIGRRKSARRFLEEAIQSQ